MQPGWVLVSGATFLLALIGGGSAVLAQEGRTWVDPPADLAAPPEAARPEERARERAPAPAEAAPPAQSARPSRPDPAREEPPRRIPPTRPAVAAQPRDADADGLAARERSAKEFAVSYLDSWSAPNEAALGATAEFYAPRVLYHGRTMSLKRLSNEKRRFVRRWPEREYRPRQETIDIVCKHAGDVCTVHAVFDFVAANPVRGRRAQGTGALQLILDFNGERPLIVAEHSTVLSLSRKRNLAMEGPSDD